MIHLPTVTRYRLTPNLAQSQEKIMQSGNEVIPLMPCVDSHQDKVFANIFVLETLDCGLAAIKQLQNKLLKENTCVDRS